MAVDRDRIVSTIVDQVRDYVRDLIYAGKSPDAVASVLVDTLSSMRRIAQLMPDSADPRAKMLTRSQVEECKMMRETLRDDFLQFMWDSAIASGAHPVSMARRLRDSMLAGIETEDDDGNGPVSHGL